MLDDSRLPNVFRIGLTGTFGCGKSTVAGMLADLGAVIVDADAIAREAVEPGTPALEEIRRTFGDQYIGLDGRLDRQALGRTVFVSPERRHALNAIVHPHVIREMERRAALWTEAHPPDGLPLVIVFNVPLLFERGLTEGLDETLVVTVSEAARFHRVRRRDNISETEVVARLAAQWPQRDKAALADAVIDNSGPLDTTRQQVRALYAEWMRKWAKRSTAGTS